VGQTTQTPLDQVEALLAQQRLAQEQLGQALKTARTEQQLGYLSAGEALSGPQWSSVAVITMAVLMCACITAVVVVKVVRPKLKTLRDQRVIERAKQEEMFVQFSLHGEDADHHQTTAEKNLKTNFRMERRSAAQEHVPDSGYLAAKEATYTEPETAKVADDVEIDFDLDLSAYDELPASAALTEPSPQPSPFLVAPAEFAPAAQPESDSNMSDEVRKVQQSLAEKRLARQAHLLPLRSPVNAALATQATQPLLLPSSEAEPVLNAPVPVDASIQVAVAAELALEPELPLIDARWQTQLDLAKEFCSLGQLQEAALIYAELVAHGEPEVAQRADALLSALPQSR
jgi:FimV-like protein